MDTGEEGAGISLLSGNARSSLTAEPWAAEALRLTLGALLLLAALLKGQELLPGAGFPDRIALPWQSLTLVAVEVVVGLGLWSRRKSRWFWPVAIVLFGAFACYSLRSALRGHASCGCFGQVAVSPWISFAVDIVGLVGLISCWPAARRSRSVAPRIVALAGALCLVGWMGGTGAWPSSVVFRGSEAVVLEPKGWTAQPFPLLKSIDIGEELSRGEWLVVLYHSDCSKCQEVVARYQLFATAWLALGGLHQPNVALIEMPPYGRGWRGIAGHSHVRYGRVSDEKNWVVTTPVEIALDDGLVTEVFTRRLGRELSWIN